MTTALPQLALASRLLRIGLWLALCAAWPGAWSAATDPAALYHDYCSVCHGDRGDGKSRASGSFSSLPRDFTSEASRRELSVERIEAAIAHGRPGTAMVGWKSQLSERDIRGLAEYVHQRFVLGAGGDPRGRQVYERNCAVCHGDRGAGSVWARNNMARPPRDFTAPASQSLTRAAMVAAVTDGRAGTPMAAYGSRLSTADIEAVVDYIRTALMAGPSSGTRAHGGREADTASTPARVDMKVGLPNGLKGDFRRGGAFYAANCAVCHGLQGDGAGPRAYFINPKPRNFIEPGSRARLNRIALYAAISEGRLGTEMPAWRQVATPQQVADVAEYVFRQFIEPDAVSQAPPRR